MGNKLIKAHYKRDTNEAQSLNEHLINVAKYGKKQAESLGQGDVVFLLGLYHDLGKANKAFQDKLEMQPNKHVDHSSAGAIYLFQSIQACLKKSAIPMEDRILFQEISAYVISAHHGMYNIFLEDEGVQAEQFAFNKLRHRMTKCMNNLAYQEDILPFAQELEAELNTQGYSDLNDLIVKAFDNYQQAWSKLNWSDESEKDYYSACFIRMYLSFLKNADILDTINAYDLLIEPIKDEEKRRLKEFYLKAIEKKYDSFSHPTTRLNEIRSQIGERVKSRGKKDSTGIYRLDLPTGAGKTNLSMRYAFHQLVDQNKSRFFYITPFLSVLEQNAAAIKKVIGEDGVLEHHSNVVQNKQENEDKGDEKESLLPEYLIESWDSSVVLTSMVQFFQTLFKTKSANIRRFSNLANSIIILDEVQSLHIEVTTLFNLTMNFLNKVMNTTIVLCTATQPVYDSTAIKHSLSYGGEHAKDVDIVDLTSEEREVFSRTELRKFNENNQKANLSDLVEFVMENDDESILAIFNTKKTVDKFYMMLDGLAGRPIYQLSTNMCAQHRLDIISEIKQQLKKGIPIICISTQLIEAGVDIDFNRVIRSYAGVDSIVQASGRCNREGKRDKGQVTLVNLTAEEENLSRLKEIKAKKDATEHIIHKASSPIEMSLLNRDFFEYYYANNQGSMDYPLSHGESVYDYLSINSYQDRKDFKGKLKQAFKTAGLKMNLINNDTIGVLVPYGEAIEKLLVLEELCEYDYPSVEDYQAIKALLKELQPYTVNVRQHDQILEATKSYLNGQIQILSDGYYDEKKGITLESGSFLM